MPRQVIPPSFTHCTPEQESQLQAHLVSAEIDSSGQEYNVLRVEREGPAIFQSPAVLPIFGSETSSSQGSNQESFLESGSLSWRRTTKDPLEPLDRRPRRGSCSFPVRRSFSLSSVDSTKERLSTLGIPRLNEEQNLLGYQTMKQIAKNRNRSGVEASVDFSDQDGFFAICWTYFVAWIHMLFAKVIGRTSTASVV